MQSLRRIFRLARASAHSTCGWLAYRLGWHGTARRQFERVLLLRGADFRAYVHLGRIAFDHGDYAGWRREFEHARRTDPIRFARLRHPIELFEPRLAGTQFEGSHELDGYRATDARATWRAMHPFGADPLRHADPYRGQDAFGREGRSPDGFGRGTDLPLAPGYDPMTPSQQLDDCDPEELHDRLQQEGRMMPDDGSNQQDRSASDDADRHSGGTPGSCDEDQGSDKSMGDLQQTPGRSMPDAAMSRDDFASPIERRRFQLRRPIDRQEIARCDLNELARRLSS